MSYAGWKAGGQEFSRAVTSPLSKHTHLQQQKNRDKLEKLSQLGIIIHVLHRDVMVYDQLLKFEKQSYLTILHKITINGVLIFCGTKSSRKSDIHSVLRHRASQILVLLPQVELAKSPKVKRLLIDFQPENKTACPFTSAC